MDSSWYEKGQIFCGDVRFEEGSLSACQRAERLTAKYGITFRSRPLDFDERQEWKCINGKIRENAAKLHFNYANYASNNLSFAMDEFSDMNLYDVLKRIEGGDRVCLANLEPISETDVALLKTSIRSLHGYVTNTYFYCYLLLLLVLRSE